MSGLLDRTRFLEHVRDFKDEFGNDVEEYVVLNEMRKDILKCSGHGPTEMTNQVRMVQTLHEAPNYDLYLLEILVDEGSKTKVVWASEGFDREIRVKNQFFDWLREGLSREENKH